MKFVFWANFIKLVKTNILTMYKKFILFYSFLFVVLISNSQELVLNFEVEIEAFCDMIPITFDESNVSGGCEPYSIIITDLPVSGQCAGNIIREVQVDDDCGNSEFAQQIISLSDTTAPVFTYFPEDITVLFDGNPGPIFEFEDNCTDIGGLDINIEVIEETEEEFPIIITYFVSIEDDCNNNVSGTQTVTFVEGDCGLESACNYDPSAEYINNDLCLFNGVPCQNQGIMGVVNENCECELTIEGYVFIDDNFSGTFNFSEIPLPFQTITLEPSDLTTISNDEGYYSFQVTNLDDLELGIEYFNEWESYTTPISYLVSEGATNSNFNFGVSNLETPPISMCVDFYQSGNGVPCNDILNYNICYRNTSPYPIDGEITIELDPLTNYYSSSPDAESIEGNTITWSFENLQPYEMFFDNIVINTPSELSIGEYITHELILNAGVTSEFTFALETEITQEVTCAYDPNDITAIPEGYTDEHYILSDQNMEFVVRFQNTGNAPAGTVLVIDSLDSKFDPSTFELVANSHSVNTTINLNGTIEFLFEEINLPDSTENEPESHGLVSYRIDLKEEVIPNDVLFNTAYIYFDNNPPIVTNTTWHTIYQCTDELADFEILTEEPFCENVLVSFINNQDLIEDYYWEINGTFYGMEAEGDYLPTASQDYTINLSVSNPLCEANSFQNIIVNPMPAIEIIEDQEICVGEEIVLVAESDLDIIWDDGTLGDELTVSPEVSTNYFAYVYSEIGCPNESLVTVTVNQLSDPSFSISGSILTAFESDASSFQWILDGNWIEGANQSSYEIIESGNYSLVIENEHGCISESKESYMNYVSVDENENFNLNIFPNPTTNSLTVDYSGSRIIKSVKIVDLLGQEIKTAEINRLKFEENLDVGDLPNGLYYLQFEFTNGKSFHKTFSKQR